MTDAGEIDLIKERVQSLEESVQFFGARYKSEREIWVANSFITNLNIPFEKAEVISPEQDPPDVIFRDAQFEIKEILDPGRRRHAEYKKMLEHARTITDPKQLLLEFTPIDKTIAEIYELCLKETKALTKYPTALRADTDLLFYVNLYHVMGLTEEPFPDTSELAALGWRSVSFVKGYRSCVLTASPGAPEFLASIAENIRHRENYK
ncbi:MAG: DUF1780 domain-containing protein [Candidatus Thiodiazotropha sp. (ex Semelilucina semeliformis)]|nr:DUF1780 domain-containing protein [Candidatus Thiodiazotropha sp. (ex Semelilucina semeliformis)]